MLILQKSHGEAGAVGPLRNLFVESRLPKEPFIRPISCSFYDSR